MGTAIVTLYATWTANPTYTVTYNSNGATGGSPPTDSTNYEQGATVTVQGNTGNLVNTNFTFTGWNTLANGSGTTYINGQTFQIGAANVTLYAMWTSNLTYTVTYNGNGATGGTVPIDTTNYEQGQSFYVLGNTGNLVQTNFSFTGWNTMANGSGTTYYPGAPYTMGSSNLTLYAMWTANPTYTVTYNRNGATGGTVPIDTTNYEQEQTVTVLGNSGNLIQTGYTFAGWNTMADGSGTTYTPGQTFMIGSSNVTLYVMWNYSVSGIVTYYGTGLSGVSVMLRIAASTIYTTTTDINGNYTLVGPKNGEIGYYILPSLAGYTFSPWEININMNSPYATGQNFAAVSTIYQFATKWGSVGSGNGQFYSFDHIAADASGNVYVADYQNNRIQKFSSSGVYITQWGSYGTGNGQFNEPYAVAADASGNVYVSDWINNRIQKFSSSGVYITQWGSYGTGNGQFNGPQSIVVDASGNVYVLDSGNYRIQKFDSSGNFLFAFGSQGTGDGQFKGPYDIAVYANSVYVLDSDVCIKIWSTSATSGSFSKSICNAGADSYHWGQPLGIAVDAFGNIFISDTFNNRLQMYDYLGTWCTTWGGAGTGNGQFNQPHGIVVDVFGNVYVADSNNVRVQKFSPQ
jgi:uncharacterized repeat protein (TIGR02543 family)